MLLIRCLVHYAHNWVNLIYLHLTFVVPVSSSFVPHLCLLFNGVPGSGTVDVGVSRVQFSKPLLPLGGERSSLNPPWWKLAFLSFLSSFFFFLNPNPRFPVFVDGISLPVCTEVETAANCYTFLHYPLLLWHLVLNSVLSAVCRPPARSLSNCNLQFQRELPVSLRLLFPNTSLR